MSGLSYRLKKSDKGIIYFEFSPLLGKKEEERDAVGSDSKQQDGYYHSPLLLPIAAAYLLPPHLQFHANFEPTAGLSDITQIYIIGVEYIGSFSVNF